MLMFISRENIELWVSLTATSEINSLMIMMWGIFIITQPIKVSLTQKYAQNCN